MCSRPRQCCVFLTLSAVSHYFISRVFPSKRNTRTSHHRKCSFCTSNAGQTSPSHATLPHPFARLLLSTSPSLLLPETRTANVEQPARRMVSAGKLFASPRACKRMYQRVMRHAHEVSSTAFALSSPHRALQTLHPHARPCSPAALPVALAPLSVALVLRSPRIRPHRSLSGPRHDRACSRRQHRRYRRREQRHYMDTDRL